MKTNSDLRKSRLACQQLDTKCGHMTPVLRWYWPEDALPEPEDDESDDDDDDDGLDIEVLCCCFVL